MSTDISPYQVAAWQAAAVGVLLALVQLFLGILKQRSDMRRERAKFGYELLDKMYAEDWACEFLYLVDFLEAPSGRTQAEAELAHGFETMFGTGGAVEDAIAKKVYERLDSFLYFLDRFEHSIRAGLTTFEDVRTPTEYYASAVAKYRQRLAPYISSIGYRRAICFLGRFNCEWENYASSSAFSDKSQKDKRDDSKAGFQSEAEVENSAQTGSAVS